MFSVDERRNKHMTNILPYDCKCFLMSYKPENLSTITLRAYRKNDPSQCFDINFFTTHYLSIPVVFEETLLVIASEEETSRVLRFLTGFPKGLQKTALVFRFGPKNSGRYIVSGAYSIQQQVGNGNEKPPENKREKPKWEKYKETPKELSKISGFYLSAMLLMEWRFYLSITATTHSNKEAYHIECQDVQYLQAPVISMLGCKPFSIADKDDTAHFIQENRLEKQSDLILLKTIVENAPVNILCSSFFIEPYKTI